ncbi:Crp/Fnr family transcriptional regulator [Micromonospora sp. CPCC 206061]|uniref:Crp/Fnr family transcriptional regulator n=1 Tax=Micromonospora sp. CPCC 206061 TaxID=3122410 RepID=UPI002FEF64D4
MTSLATIPAFAALDARTLVALERESSPIRYAAGAVIRPAAGPAGPVILLLRGTIVTAYPAASGGQFWAGRWDGPSIVDKPAVLGGPALSGALLATTAVTGRALPTVPFLRLLDDEPRVRRHVLGKLAADALALQQRMADAVTLPAVARVARSLLAEGAWRGSQEDLGRALGLSRVTVNRALARLAAESAIRLTPGGVDVTNQARLSTFTT